MASDIAVAFIGGGAGLLTGAVTGTISSLVAPWANWGIEKKRLTRERRVRRIKEWRDGVENLDWAEANHGQEGYLTTERISGDVRTKDWWVTLRPEMSPDVLNEVEGLSEQPIHQRHGKISKLIQHEITRIEREKWKLV
ncbi:hypothetical protein [Mycobacterium sp. 050134]|uniref:hypothetical protein n=1 Tax=Mycobacterium sp. 050134 TaxID=3096111 RepID=UPI002ED771A7